MVAEGREYVDHFRGDLLGELGFVVLVGVREVTLKDRGFDDRGDGVHVDKATDRGVGYAFGDGLLGDSV